MRTIHGTTWSVEDAREYIKARVEVDANGCWIWRRATNDNGYGRFDVPRAHVACATRARRAHRLAYEAFVGPIPKHDSFHGMCVCHTCDIRLCCNPEHLFLGTQLDNVSDMLDKGRHRPPRGESHPSAKLTDDDVRTIRQSSDGIRELARRFGVAHPQIIRIKSGRGWRQV